MNIRTPPPASDSAVGVGPDATPGPALEDAHPHRPRGDSRRQILDVALDLIAERGYAGTPLREIAERMGFTKAALYYHFRTKEDLLVALLAPAAEDLERLVDSVRLPTTPEQKGELLAGYVALVRKHAKFIRVLSEDQSVRHSPALLGPEEMFRRLAALLAGTEDPDVTQRARVRAALGGIHAVVVRADPDDDADLLAAAATAAATGALGASD